MSEIKEAIELKGLVISRLPSWAKTYIKERAKEEFCDDYGQVIAYLIKQANEYELFKAKFLNSELALQIINNSEEQSEDTSETVRKSISGHPIKSFGGKK